MIHGFISVTGKNVKEIKVVKINFKSNNHHSVRGILIRLPLVISPKKEERTHHFDVNEV